LPHPVSETEAATDLSRRKAVVTVEINRTAAEAAHVQIVDVHVPGEAAQVAEVREEVQEEQQSPESHPETHVTRTINRRVDEYRT